ncbi:MAG: hypothetical protein ABIN96_04435 [Rubrivivax sp.]
MEVTATEARNQIGQVSAGCRQAPVFIGKGLGRGLQRQSNLRSHPQTRWFAHETAPILARASARPAASLRADSRCIVDALHAAIVGV